jgi:hypothetical protein
VSMACGTDAAFCVTDDGTDAAAVGLKVNEFGFDRPACIGGLIAEEQEALVDLDVVLAFDVGGFELVHCLVGLEGFEIGDDEADKNPIKAASDGEQGDGVHYSVNDAFNLVHSFGFSVRQS